MSQDNILPFNSAMIVEDPNKTQLTLKMSYSVLKMYAKLSKSFPTEVCAMHSVKFTGEFFEVLPVTTDSTTSPLFIPKQEATVATTTREATAYLSMPDTFRFNCEIHTHPMESTEPSGTDIENFKTWSKNCDDYLVFVIISYGSVSAFIYTYRGLVAQKLEVVIDMSKQTDLYTTYLPIFKERVTQAKVTNNLNSIGRYSPKGLYTQNGGRNTSSEYYDYTYLDNPQGHYLDNFPEEGYSEYDYLGNPPSNDEPIALLKETLTNNLQEIRETRNFRSLTVDKIYPIAPTVSRSYDENSETFTWVMDTFMEMQIDYMPSAYDYWGTEDLFKDFQAAMASKGHLYELCAFDILKTYEDYANTPVPVCEVAIHILLIIGFVPTLLPTVIMDLELGRLKIIHHDKYPKKLLSQLHALNDLHNEQL